MRSATAVRVALAALQRARDQGDKRAIHKWKCICTGLAYGASIHRMHRWSSNIDVARSLDDLRSRS
ncbi:hypothetical protein [Caulobacter phage KSC]|uniref:Uncharacterized protein n=1 Tax=Caulobacter phage KSC TaxID=3020398 RepID=A0AAE9X6Q0_9CAUD|nr:hypothetical protein [Caulobacter phage KSC]